MSESGIVTGMGTPGTYRVSDGGPLPGDLDMHAGRNGSAVTRASARTCHPVGGGLR
jgi:hypothetical protein